MWSALSLDKTLSKNVPLEQWLDKIVLEKNKMKQTSANNEGSKVVEKDEKVEMEAKVEDKFNPIPDYWKRISEKEMEKWQGNSEVIYKFIKDISANDIKNYYKFWRRDNVQEEKAYEEDEFGFGDDWQVVDFMNKLSIIYPFEEENGFPMGKTYKITLKDKF